MIDASVSSQCYSGHSLPYGDRLTGSWASVWILY